MNISDLSNDVLGIIFMSMPQEYLIDCVTVCKQWHNIIDGLLLRQMKQCHNLTKSDMIHQYCSKRYYILLIRLLKQDYSHKQEIFQCAVSTNYSLLVNLLLKNAKITLSVVINAIKHLDVSSIAKIFDKGEYAYDDNDGFRHYDNVNVHEVIYLAHLNAYLRNDKMIIDYVHNKFRHVFARRLETAALANNIRIFDDLQNGAMPYSNMRIGEHAYDFVGMENYYEMATRLIDIGSLEHFNRGLSGGCERGHQRMVELFIIAGANTCYYCHRPADNHVSVDNY